MFVVRFVIICQISVGNIITTVMRSHFSDICKRCKIQIRSHEEKNGD